MWQPIYKPRGPAAEYSPWALNIYTGCPHRCYYCYARAMAKRFSGGKYVFKFDTPEVRERHGVSVVDAAKRQLTLPKFYGQGLKIMLCFTCDPYPIGFDTSATRAVIKAIKESGNHVQILTKGDKTAQRDFDLLDHNDSFGVSWTGAEFFNDAEPGAAPHNLRFYNLFAAKQRGLHTWLSCEPVLEISSIYAAIETFDFVDLFRIGKLNHHKSDIDWPAFGRRAEALCRVRGRNYYITDNLHKVMEVV